MSENTPRILHRSDMPIGAGWYCCNSYTGQWRQYINRGTAVTAGRCTIHDDQSVTVHPLTGNEQARAMAVMYPVSRASPRTGREGTQTPVKQDKDTGTGQGGIKKGQDPQRGGASVNHSAPLNIYGINQYWT